jgi:hypothetical protein
MFREGLDRFFPSFGREGPLLRVGILSESEGVEVARRPVKETPRASRECSSPAHSRQCVRIFGRGRPG